MKTMPTSKSESQTSSAAPVKHFRDLKIWQEAKSICVAIYRLTKLFPRDEVFGLTAQMRGAAVSISSNIAEGFNRHDQKDYQQFLFTSLGSCGELKTQIEIAGELGLIQKSDCLKIIEKLDHESRMIRSLISRISEASKMKKAVPGPRATSPEQRSARPVPDPA